MTVAAPTATTWQSLYNLYWIFAIAAGTITIGALVVFSVKYRNKAGRQEPVRSSERAVPTAVIVVIVVMAVILASAAFESFQAIGVYDNAPNDPNTIHVNVTGQRFSWTFNCTSPCSTAGNVLTVPADTVVILNITSIDVFHSFAIPALRVKADAIPGRFNTLWFKAPAGTYIIQCYELCGNGHAFMIGKLNVV